MGCLYLSMASALVQVDGGEISLVERSDESDVRLIGRASSAWHSNLFQKDSLAADGLAAHVDPMPHAGAGYLVVERLAEFLK